MDLREKLKVAVQAMHNATTDAYIESLDGCEMSYADQINIEVDTLISNGVTVQEWISVKDRLPQGGEYVLGFGYMYKTLQPIICYLSTHYKGEWYTGVAGQRVYGVTHWMPLPEPPKGE